jgi:hypothetical protein
MDIAGVTARMKLPSVTTTLSALAFIWCIAGYAAHGKAILAYPLAWFVLCAFFLVLNKAFDVVRAATAKPVAARAQVAASRPKAGKRTEEQVSAA